MSTKLTARERLELVNRALGGESISTLCKEAGISRTLLYRWIKRYTSNHKLNEALDPESSLGSKSNPRTVSEENIRLILEITKHHPDWGVSKIVENLPKDEAGKPSVGNHGVQNVLRRLDLTTFKKRQKFWTNKDYIDIYQTTNKDIKEEDSNILEKKGQLLRPQDRLEMIERVGLGESVTRICRIYGISRTVFYRWQKRYEQAPEGNKLEALWDQKPKIERYYKQASEEYEQSVLSAVRQYPELSSHKLVWVLPQVGGRPILGNHGVQNVLRRHDLSTFEQRISFSQAYHRPTLASRFFSGFQSLFSYVGSQQPAERKLIVRASLGTALGLFFGVVIYGSISLGRLVLGAPSIAFSIGLIFALISLTFGMFFFIYSLKYYFTIAAVLSFSRRGSSRDENDAKENESVFSHFFHNNHLTPGVLQYQGGLGLQSDLSAITLDRTPFISIHLATYNEKKVIDRLLTAATSMEYENYEVVLADDSTDETLEILKKWENHPRVKILHRATRQGFKGGALAHALKAMDKRAEFVIVLDADFIPYPDTITQFLKYFKSITKGISTEDIKKTNVAAIQGYQWHVLNKSENWITRGVRSEYAGSYVMERSGIELYSGLKQIAGSVYMIRADVLKAIGWGTSITEDFELTLKLYQAGYKVVFTPYIQAPAEAVSTIKRLIRQRMRWAEGHSHNIKSMFTRIIFSDKLTRAEKLEFLYLSPYYLQAFFFILGTLSWFLAEVVFGARLPFWTSTWGWSLVFTNLLALPLMNIVGLFMEESDEKDYLGIFSFVAMSYIVAPFQGYASVKGFLEQTEGPWFRTPKSGKITDVFTPGRLYKFVFGVFGRRAKPAAFSANYANLISQASMANLEGLEHVQRIEDGYVFSEEQTEKEYQSQSQPSRFGLKAAVNRLLQKLGLTRTHHYKAGQPLPLARLSSFNSFSSFKPPKQKNLFVGKIILACFIFVALAINNFLLFNQYHIDWGHFELKDKDQSLLVNKAGLAKFGLIVRPPSIKLAQGGPQGGPAPVAPDPAIEQQINIIDQEYITNLADESFTNIGIFDTTSQGQLLNIANRSTAHTLTIGASTYVYVLGAKNTGTALSTAYKATLDSTTGDVGAFVTTSQGQLVRPVFNHFSVTASSINSSTYVYILGGTDQSGVLYSAAYRATVNTSSGDLGAFATTGQTQPALTGERSAIFTATVGASTYVYGIGGDIATGASVSTVRKATIDSSTGNLLAFNTTSQAQVPTTYFNTSASVTVTSTIGSSTYAYVIGGIAGASSVLVSTIYKVTVDSNNGNLAQTQGFNTTSQGQLPALLHAQSSVSTKIGTSTYVYVLGGCNNAVCGSNTALSTVYRATVDSNNGNVGIFSTTNQVQLSVSSQHPNSLASPQIASSTYVYVIGGFGNANVDQSTVYKTELEPPTHKSLGHVRWTSGSYTPAPTVYFEADIKSSDGSTTTATLYSVAGAAVSGSAITTNNRLYTRVRSGAITLTDGTDYTVGLTSSSTTGDAAILGARLIVPQTDSVLVTATETQIELGANENTTSSSSTNLLTNPKIWLYNSANYDGTVNIYFEASLLTSSAGAAAHAFLYDLTTGSVVSSSDISSSDTAWTRVRSAALSLTAGDEYQAGFYSGTSGTKISIASAKVVITQSAAGGITKTELYHNYINSIQTQNSASVNTFATSYQAQLPQIATNLTSFTSTVGASTYIYVIGGSNAGLLSTSYRATLNASNGSVGAFSTTSQGQTLGLLSNQSNTTAAIGSSTYVYLLGGCGNATCTAASGMRSTVYRATIDSSTGNLGTFTTTSQTQVAILNNRNVSITSPTIGASTYVYVLGGSAGGGPATASTVYKLTLDSSAGNVNTFNTTSQAQLFQALFQSPVVSTTIGSSTYLYVVGGDQGSATFVSTVHKATLSGTSGDVGAFNTTSQGQLLRINGGSSAMTLAVGSSTYLYVVGGAGQDSTVYRSTINGGSGNLGVFATTYQMQLPIATTRHTAVSATINSSTYVYVMGGTTTTQASSVFRATIFNDFDSFGYDNLYNSNNWAGGTFTYYHEGTLKTSQTNGTANARLVPGSLGSIQSSSGDLGAFATTSQGQLTDLNRRSATLTATIGSSTYVYTIGGVKGSGRHSIVYKATINSTNGDMVAPFNTTSQAQLPRLLGDNSAVTATVGASTYVYVLGGCTNPNCAATTTADLFSTVYKVTVDSNNGNLAQTQGFNTTSQGQILQATRDTEAIAAIIGSSTYVYVLGGVIDIAGTAVSTSSKAVVDGASGDLGTFTTTSQAQLLKNLSPLTETTVTIGSSTYLYVLGGSISGVRQSVVYKVTIDSTNGDMVAPFNTTSQAQLPEVNDRSAAISASVGNSSYIYVIGGTNRIVPNPYKSTVYKAVVNTNNGNVGIFDTTNQAQLPLSMREHAVVSSVVGTSTYIYVLGGASSTSSVVIASTAYKAILNVDQFKRVRSSAITPTSAQGGNAGIFDTTSQGQQIRVFKEVGASTATIGSSTYVYVIGGSESAAAGVTRARSTIFRATIQTLTGDVGTFDTTSQKQIPVGASSNASGLRGAGVVSATVGSSTYLYVMGGATLGETSKSTVYKLQLDSSNGTVTTFNTTSQAQLLGGLVQFSKATATVGPSTYVYVLGGNAAGTLTTNYRATVNSSSGDLGAFNTTSQAQLIVTTQDHSAITQTIGSSTYIYVIGGNLSSSIYKGIIDSGTGYVALAQPFTTTSQTQLPQLLANNASITATVGPSSYLYVFGGYNTPNIINRSTVYKATLNTVGDVGTFDTTSQGQIPQLITDHAVVSATGGSSTYFYVLGGLNSTSSFSFLSTNYKAVVSADGTEYDSEAQNATVANSWLVINITALAVPENLLGLLPFGILLPKIIEKLKRRRKKHAN